MLPLQDSIVIGCSLAFYSVFSEVFVFFCLCYKDSMINNAKIQFFV